MTKYTENKIYSPEAESESSPPFLFFNCYE
nr:MAG TPA: hypothetical protein [Caudoviricetes sp.]